MSDTETNINLTHTTKLQIVIVLRYKPSDNAMAAGSMLDGVSSAAKGVSDAVDKAMSYVPGVLEEQKKQEEPLDEDYNYHEAYPKHWDKVLKETENTLKEMDEKNKYILFEYDSNDNLEKHVSSLEAQVKAAISPLSEAIYGIHFVGLAQGGNIAVDCASKIKNSLGQYGRIESILCVGTALHGEASKSDFLSTIPNVANYKSSFDLSSNAILYAKEPEKIIETIKLANKTPIKYMYTMLIGKITKILSQLLNGLNLGTSNGIDPLKNLIESIKSDVKSVIEDILKFIKHLATSFKEFLKMPDIDQKFDKVFGNIDGVVADAIERLKQFLKIIEDVFISGVKKGKLNLMDLPIEKLFNFLTPPVLLIDNAFNALTIDLNDRVPANNLKEFTSKGAFYKPITKFDKQLSTKDPYQKVVLESAQNKDLDQLTSLISVVRQGTVTLGDESISDAKREETGISLSRILMLPMLSGKTEILSHLMKKLPSLGNNPALNKIQSDTVTAPLIGLMKKLRENFDFDNTDTGNDKELGLKKALGRLDSSIGRIKEIMKPDYFKIDKKYNALHFIYNSHNIALAEMPKELRISLDRATNIYQYKIGKGFEYNALDGSYKPGKDGIKTEDVMVVEAEKETT